MGNRYDESSNCGCAEKLIEKLMAERSHKGSDSTQEFLSGLYAGSAAHNKQDMIMILIAAAVIWGLVIYGLAH